MDPQQRPASVKLLQDRRPPYYPLPKLQRRPDRTIDELLRDLNGWEQHVDVADIEFLEKAGISRHVLDESLRAIRFNNETFGPMDYAMRQESLEPSKGTGQQYRDIVQLFIECLKECISTPEDPGETFKSLFPPNVIPDLSYFEKEGNRLDRIKTERSRTRSFP
jgi:hypothetical protein